MIKILNNIFRLKTWRHTINTLWANVVSCVLGISIRSGKNNKRNEMAKIELTQSLSLLSFLSHEKINKNIKRNLFFGDLNSMWMRMRASSIYFGKRKRKKKWTERKSNLKWERRFECWTIFIEMTKTENGFFFVWISQWVLCVTR